MTSRPRCVSIEIEQNLATPLTVLDGFFDLGRFVCAVNGKVNFPEATTFVASVSAVRILGRCSSEYIQKPWILNFFPMRSPCGTWIGEPLSMA